MKNNNFWNDAALHGTMIGGAAIIFALAGNYLQTMALGLAWFVVFAYMLYYFVRQRAMQCATPDGGFSYGRCLGFAVAMMLFTGFMEGVYSWIVANWLFVEQFDEQVGRSMVMLEGMGIYSAEQLELAVSMMRSPITLIFAGILSAVFRGLIFGLIIAAFTKRNPNPFADSDIDVDVNIHINDKQKGE